MAVHYISAGILLCFALCSYFIYQRKSSKKKEGKDDKYEINKIIEEVDGYFHNKLSEKKRDIWLSDKEIKKQTCLRVELKHALQDCCYGDMGAKTYVKEYIKEWILLEYGITENTIDKIIPFHNQARLSVLDKFDILLHIYRKEFEKNAVKEMFTRHLFLNSSRQEAQSSLENQNTPSTITSKQIEEAYDQRRADLTFADKVEIVVQRIYQHYKGLGVIDEIRDLNLDGVSSGVSGTAWKEGRLETGADKEHGNIWIFFKGVHIRLAFMAFESSKELERVARNIYRYGKPGQLSAARGYIVNEMQDGSRVVVVRPPFAENWAFFIRKYHENSLLSLEELFTSEGCESVFVLLKTLIAGEQVIGVTGEQGAGKTTLLKALVRLIPACYTLRVQELVFELHLKEIYPERNILSFRETEVISGREGLELQKKTDGTVNIIGEVASSPVASWLITISQAASRFTLFTHHAKTAENLVMSLRNDLLTAGGFRDEEAAEAQVRMAVRFDVHLAKSSEGKRFVERITEILPCTKEQQAGVRDILRMEKGHYQLVNRISRQTLSEMVQKLSVHEISVLEQMFLEVNKTVGEIPSALGI